MSDSRCFIVTGGNAGLGLEAAKALIADQAIMVVIACRNADRGEAAVRQLAYFGGRAIFLPLDLNDQVSIRAFVKSFILGQHPPLFGIICNAGMQDVGSVRTSAQGYESTFAVNHLGHYLLVRLLLDEMAHGGRITMVSSGTHDPKQRTGMPEPVYRNADDLAGDMEAGRTPALRRYTTSKLCNVFFTYELSRRLSGSGNDRLASIRVNALDPGLMPATGLARSWPAPLRWISRNILPLMRFVNNNVHLPAHSGKRLADLTSGADADPGGRYFSNGRAIPSSDLSYDRQKQHELWATSARMSKFPEEV